jgi:hypothetical protein
MVPEFSSQIELSISQIDLPQIRSDLASLSFKGVALNTSFTDKKTSSFSRILRKRGLAIERRNDY